jgi:GxxExxY protein
MHENDVSQIVLDRAIEVHRVLGGPGLLESVYEQALVWELIQCGLRVEHQKAVPVRYKGRTLPTPLRLDLQVEDKVIVECKAISEDNPIFRVQVLTYLRVTGCRLGLVINFGQARVRDGFHRIVNGL